MAMLLDSDLAQSVNSMILESHPPHKIVNLLFTITDANNKMTVLWGALTFSDHSIDILSEINSYSTVLPRCVPFWVGEGDMWGYELIFTVTEVNRGFTFALKRSTLDVCLGGQRES